MQNSIPVDDLIAGKQIRTYNDAVLALPPAFYNLKLKFRPKDQEAQQPIDSSWNMGTLVEDGEFTIDKMSSGERQMLYSLSYVLYHIKNIQSVREDENRVAYHNICLIFDEAELYFHPDYQRRFLSMLLEAISWCNIDTERIHSIQILIVTHSPFILTDMLTENTLYLEKGKVKKVTQQTFGGNYYDLLNKSFFFEKSAVGDVAIRNLNKWIELSNQGETISEDILALVGDDLIRGYLSRN
jgi:predicted ATP-binding protein involved in virulence